MKNHQKKSEINKKFKSGQKKYFNQFLGAHSIQKLVKIHNKSVLPTQNYGILYSSCHFKSILSVINSPGSKIIQKSFLKVFSNPEKCVDSSGWMPKMETRPTPKAKTVICEIMFF